MYRTKGLSRFIGWSIVLLGPVAAVGLAGCDAGTAVPSGLWLEAVTPITLTGTVGQVVAPTPVVLVTDEDGRPREGVLVRFSLKDGLGSLDSLAVETDAAGLASAGTWTLGGRAGTQALAAWVGTAIVYFVVDVQAGPPAAIFAKGGTDGQIGDAGTTLPRPLVALITDAPFGNPVAEAPVTFTVLSGGGVIAAVSAFTDGGGAASATWVLGPSLGVQEVKAQSGTLEAVFTAFALCPADSADCRGSAATLEGRIAFVSTRDGNAEIYAVNVDGTDLRRLTDDDAFDESPAWSPDGSRIAFVSNRTGTSQVYTMNADGTEVVQRTWADGGGWGPSWSPDGGSVVYASRELGETDIWAVSLDEDGTTLRLFSHGGSELQPVWSPDGTRLALAADWNSYEPLHIYRVEADGSGEVKVSGDGSGPFEYRNPSWSPDGLRLAFLVNIPDLRDEWTAYVCVVAADGGDLRPLMAARPFLGTSWSPDGELVAFTAGANDGKPSIAWVKADGSAAGTIIDDGFSPSWAP